MTRRIYEALISQDGTTANPTIDWVGNDDYNFLGNIVWTRVADGNYRGTLSNAFEGTVLLTIQNGNNMSNEGLYSIHVIDNDTHNIGILTSGITTGGLVSSDGMLYRTYVKIEVISE